MELYLVHVGNKMLLGEAELGSVDNGENGIYLYSVFELSIYPMNTPKGVIDMVDIKSIVPFRDNKNTDLFVKKFNFIIPIEQTEELYELYKKKRAMMSGIVTADTLPVLPSDNGGGNHLRIIK